jgi:hypothetical protein
MVTAAKHFNLGCSVDLAEINIDEIKPQQDPDDTQKQHYHKMATLRISGEHGRSGDKGLYEAIFTRTVNRGKYDSKKDVPPEILQQIQEIAKQSGVNIHLFRKRDIRHFPFRTTFAEAQLRADSTVITNEKFKRELSQWLTVNNTSSNFGMPGDTFGLGDEQVTDILSALSKGRLNADDERGFANSGKDGIESSPFVALIAVRQDSPDHFIRAGIALEESALLLEKNGISIACHAGLAEVPIGRFLLKTTGIIKGTPAILFRGGYALDPKPHSPRLSAQEAII